MKVAELMRPRTNSPITTPGPEDAGLTAPTLFEDRSPKEVGAVSDAL